jgi:hypothetical protein
MLKILRFNLQYMLWIVFVFACFVAGLVNGTANVQRKVQRGRQTLLDALAEQEYLNDFLPGESLDGAAPSEPGKGKLNGIAPSELGEGGTPRRN